MAGIDSANVNDYQYDILWDLLDDNTKLPYSPIKNVNKQLNTSSKRIIGSINELLEKLTSLGTSVNTFSENFNNVIGNSQTNPQMVANLKSIDENLLKAVFKIWTELRGDGTTDISHIGPNVKAAIYELGEALHAVDTRLGNVEQRLVVIEDKLDDLEFKDRVAVNPAEPHMFQLPHKPNAREVRLEINGMGYDEGDEFTVDRQTGVIIWTATEANGGFDIEPEFEVRPRYYYEQEAN